MPRARKELTVCNTKKTTDGFGTCRYWGKSGHLGSDDVEAHRAAKREKANSARQEMIAQEAQRTGQSNVGPRSTIDWNSPAHGNLGSPGARGETTKERSYASSS